MQPIFATDLETAWMKLVLMVSKILLDPGLTIHEHVEVLLLLKTRLNSWIVLGVVSLIAGLCLHFVCAACLLSCTA